MRGLRTKLLHFTTTGFIRANVINMLLGFFKPSNSTTFKNRIVAFHNGIIGTSTTSNMYIFFAN